VNAVPLLVDFLYDSARRLPEKVALVAGEERITYAELESRVNALARTAHSRTPGIE
jgi:non-ribosomal peptide synthetase component E (peptide arylation enzyme)